MRVMCIAKNGWVDEKTKASIDGPQYGEFCEMSHLNGDGFCVITAYPLRNEGGWEPLFFIPLSSIDEREMVREKQTEKV